MGWWHPDPQGALLDISLRDEHATHGVRSIRSPSQFGRQFVEPSVSPVRLDVLEGLAVHPRGAVVGPATQVGLPIATEKKNNELGSWPRFQGLFLLETRLRGADSRNRIRERLSRIKNLRNHAVSSEGLEDSRLPSFARADPNNCHPEDRWFFLRCYRKPGPVVVPPRIRVRSGRAMRSLYGIPAVRVGGAGRLRRRPGRLQGRA